MRQTTYAAAAALMAIALACSPRDRRETANVTDTVALDSTSLDSAATDVSRETGDAVRDVKENVAGDYSYDRRDEFKRDIDLRLQRLDQEIADLRRTAKRDTDKARDTAVVHIREARLAVDRSLARLAGATEATWDDVRSGVNRAVDSLDLAVRAQRPDAKPMGGTGPS
jgi:molecular chaperone GrpE (heat shock protein)